VQIIYKLHGIIAPNPNMTAHQNMDNHFNTAALNFDKNQDYRKAKMATEQGFSRIALGEINNRVSAITIDTSKGGAIKKEILQPVDSILTRAKSARLKATSTAQLQPVLKESLPSEKLISHRPFSNDVVHPVKVEVIPGHSLVPSTSRITEGDHALVDAMSHANPMDISSEAGDAYSRTLGQVEDIDAEDAGNPQLVSVYVNSIYSYMWQLESKYRIGPKFLEGSELTGKMRAILVDWLCQVHNRFHLLQETLYLTVAIIDRYLQKKPCSKNRLQLVGVTSMLVASKYEEMYAPEVADFVYITDHAYTKQDVRDMEQDILHTLDFSFGRPLCLHFLRRNSKAGQVDATKHTLAKYLMELTMVEYDMAQLKPSHIAAASLYLSIAVLGGAKWNETLCFYSSYAVEDLIPLAKKIAQLVVKAETHKLVAVRTKYSSSKFMKIALIPELKNNALKELAGDS